MRPRAAMGEPTSERASPITLEEPSLALLDGYERAMRYGWSPAEGPHAYVHELERLRADRAAYLRSLTAQTGHILLPDRQLAPRLPSRLFFICDGDFCGRISLRYQPGTAALPAYASGHIGYSVVPWKQGRGYATAALAAMLPVARSVGLPFAIVTCDRDNLASRRVAEKCGGRAIGEMEDVFARGLVKVIYRIEL